MDPLLRTFRVINFRPRQLLWNPSEERTQQNGGSRQIQEPEKSVQCEVLHDPGPSIRADVIFIHGLKGSLDRTWTQGLWDLKDPDHRSSRVLLRKSCSTSAIRQNSEASIVNRSHGSDNGLALSKANDVSENVMIENNNMITVDKVVFTCGDDSSDDSGSVSSFQDNQANDSSDDQATTPTTPAKTQLTVSKTNADDEPVSRCWPKDWLPMDCPGVRIIALNYTTDPYLWRPVWISKRSR